MSYRFTKASLLTGTIMAGAMMAAPLAAQTTATNNTDDLTDQERLDLQNHIGSALAVLYAATYRHQQERNSLVLGA